MRRVKYFVVFLLLLVIGCKQYNKEVENKSEGLKAKVGDEVIEGGEAKEEIKKTAEEALREKLNEKQKKGLDFLKEALNDEAKLNNLLGLDEGKVKAALEHIQQQLDSCTGNEADNKKTTFKTVVKEYLKGDGTNLNNFKTSVDSTCSIGVAS